MKAIILSAGYGTRLGSLTKDMPKPMLDINGKPMLEYIINNLKRHNFTDLAINLHFMPEIIKNYFEDGSKSGVKITYSYEEELMGTAGGVKNIEKFFTESDEPFIVHYGDVVTEQDFTKMLDFHKEKNALATLLLHKRKKSNSVVSLDEENRIIGFLERPSEKERKGIKSPWVNSGVCICQPEILDLIPEKTACDLPRDIFSKNIECERLFGFSLSAYRCAVDSVERLEEVRNNYNN
ncbi:nucleotidyltransferase family protein [bacterium]|nr:nucleotidyltransferase family protein [bacterium]